jgi:hypothetical protein
MPTRYIGHAVYEWHIRLAATVMIVLTLIVGCGESGPAVTSVPPTLRVEPQDKAATQTPAPEPSDAPIPLVDSGQRLGSARSWDVGLGDLDGDGDLDAFVANPYSGGANNTVWLNDGSGAFSDSGQVLGYGRGVDLGDLDGDGDLDAFVANPHSGGVNNTVWLNDGSGAFSDSGQALGNEGGWAVALGDLDGDGDLDAFVANTDANTVWLNDGNGAFTDDGQRLGGAITAAVALGDLDGDGDLDALAGGWDEPAKAWLNDGAGTFADSGRGLSPASVHIHGLALGDVDRDGDLDVIMAIASGHPNQVWINDGDGAFQDSGQALSSPCCAHGVALGDFDGDGDLDAFMANGGRSSVADKVWLNEGGVQGGTLGRFTDSGLRLSTDFSSGVGLGDLDGDGHLDAFVVHGDLARSSGGGIPNEVWLYETIAPASEAAPSLTGSGGGH